MKCSTMTVDKKGLNLYVDCWKGGRIEYVGTNVDEKKDVVERSMLGWHQNNCV